ncbi:S1 family peptidase [Streptomyces hoynatensis]|uniref:S1 family peptidase n=1 Tax=Streptomyces hoynatensis TaxID=1141874 RepID=UPI001F4E3E5C|nr:S1 family peptidase [Streptomyces hoynatensis]
MPSRHPSRHRTPRRPRRFLAVAATAVTALAALLLPSAAEAGQRPGAAPLAALGEAMRAADVPGTAWAADPASGSLRVLADETVSTAELARLREEAGALAGALGITRVPGALRPLLSGGEAVYADSGQRCTVGFDVRVGGAYYFLTAGHCADGLPTWYADPGLTDYVGPTVSASFPANDYGIVAYDDGTVPFPGTIECNGTVVEIDGALDPTVGMTVWMAGAVSGCHSGTVTGLNYTVNYGNGDIVSGLIATTICAAPGDSGAPLFTGSYAVGILSGGSGNCAGGGTSFFQPVTEILSAYGATLP